MILKLVSCCFLYLTSVFVICSVPENIPDALANIGRGELNQTTNNDNGSKLNLTVFYESLCPASVSFFKNQFMENWTPFYDYLNLSLIPYGKATQTQDKDGNWTFECQHGEDECYGNRIQACAISKMTKDKIRILFNFISCYMSHMEKEIYGPKCAQTVNIEFSELENCAKTKEGFDLLAVYGNVTHDFRPTVQWVPTIVLNNKFNQTENDLAITDLRSLLCQKLNNRQPKICTH